MSKPKTKQISSYPVVLDQHIWETKYKNVNTRELKKIHNVHKKTNEQTKNTASYRYCRSIYAQDRYILVLQ